MPTPKRMLSMGPPKQAEKPIIGAKAFQIASAKKDVNAMEVTDRHTHVRYKIGKRVTNSEDGETDDCVG